jgi:hypothetical protein
MLRDPRSRLLVLLALAAIAAANLLALAWRPAGDFAAGFADGAFGALIGAAVALVFVAGRRHSRDCAPRA